MQVVGRNVSAMQAARFVFNAAQVRFDLSIKKIRSVQVVWEGKGVELMAGIISSYMGGWIDEKGIGELIRNYASAIVSAWWDLADDLVLSFTNLQPQYPDWWLQSKEVAYKDGPPPALPVPPPATDHGP